jgi:cysteine synthase A
MKDRMARAAVEGAEARGDLSPGGTVVEYTGGTTGVSLAFVCAAKGYRLRIVQRLEPKATKSAVFLSHP